MTFIPKLAIATRKKLLDRPRSLTLDMIAEKTGLNKHWLNDFSTKTDRDHGVDKVEALYYFLTGESVIDDDENK